MKKPEVSIHAWPWLVSGLQCPFDIEVTAHDETRVDFIRARLVCEQGWDLGSDGSRMSVRRRDPVLEAELMGPGVLPTDSVTRFSTTFMLPAATPPTHTIEPAYSRMRLRIHISIPW